MTTVLRHALLNSLAALDQTGHVLFPYVYILYEICEWNNSRVF